jgi:hypothetical protein
MKQAHTFFTVLAVLTALSVDPADAQDEPSLLSPAALPEIMRIKADTGVAQDLALSPVKQDCAPDEPDSVQISWDAPCESGTWLMDTETGCRMWDWHPDPSDTVTWTGACPAGLKEGRGVVQWFEHSEHIDRFEGTYRLGRRQGFGHYVWNQTDWYEGNYEDDRPHGFGTAHIAGEIFAGRWTNGCLKNGERLVAISVPRSSCTGVRTENLSPASARLHKGHLPASHLRVARRVTEYIFDKNLARVPKPNDIGSLIRARTYRPVYST